MLFSMVEDGIPKYVFDGQVKGGGILLPQENTPAIPTLAFGDGDSGFYEGSDDSLKYAIAGVRKGGFNENGIFTYEPLGVTICGVLRNVIATNIIPSLCPNYSDFNTGVGSAAVDQLSLIAGGVEGIRITEAAGAITNNLNGQTILPLSNTPATPTLAFGDGDTGFYEVADDELVITIEGNRRVTINHTDIYGADSGKFGVKINEAASTTNPVFLPNDSDSNTGLGAAAADALSLIAGGVEGIRITEVAGAITITGGGINVEGGLSQRVAVPATAGAAGTTGQFAFDVNHFYACVGASTWVRTTLATW